MNKIESSTILVFSLIFTGCGGVTKVQDEEIKDKNEFISNENCNQIIKKEFITICYDYKLKGAKAVYYVLDGDLMNHLNIKERPRFYKEPTLDKKYQILHTDYTNSGYDRGHLAPDATFDWSQDSLNAVYTLANIIPQAPQVNRNSWADLEKYTRDKAIELGELKVLNVVKYGQRSKRMGKNKMAISKGYFKVLSNNSENYKECFYYSNKLGGSTIGDTILKHKVNCNSVTN